MNRSIADQVDNVSIRSRLLGREIHSHGVAIGYAVMCFNPLPAVGPGDTLHVIRLDVTITSFNPLPAVGPGDTALLQGYDYYSVLS